MADNINDIVGKQAYEQLATLKAELTDVVETIQTINATQINLTKGLSSQAGTANLQAVNNLLKELQNNVTALSGAYERYNSVAQQVIQKNADIAASFNLMRAALNGNVTAFNELTEAQNRYAESANKVNVATRNAGESMGIVERVVQRMLIRMAAMGAIFGTVKIAIEELKKKVDEFNYKQIASEEAAKSSTNKYSQEAVALTELKNRFNDAGSTMADKQEVVKELNTLLDGQYRSITSINDANKFFIQDSPNVIQALLERAKGEAALNAIIQEQQQLLEKQANPASTTSTVQNILTGAGAVGQALTNFSGSAKQSFSPSAFFKNIAYYFSQANQAAGQSNLPKIVEDTTKRVDFLTKAMIDAMNESKKLADQVGLIVDPDKKGKQPHDFTTSLLKDQQKYTLELAQEQAKRLQTEAEYLKLASEDETQSLSDRILAYRNYTNQEKEAQKLLIDAQIKEQKEALAEIEKLQGSKGKLSVSDQNLINSKQVVLEKIKVLTAQYGLIDVESTKKTQQGIKQIYNQDIQTRLKQLKDITDNVSIEADKQKAIEADKYKKGEINYKTFKNAEKEIDDNARVQSLDLSKQFLQQQIADSSLADADKSNLQAKLNDVMKALYDADAKNFDDAAKKKQEQNDALKQSMIDVVNASINSFVEIQDNAFQYVDELNQLQLHNAELNAQQQIQAVNAEIGAQSEKQEKLNQINAQANATENQYAAEQKQRDIQKAKFDRAAAEAKIVESTAEGVMKVWASYADAPYIAAALTAAVVAVGAVELAAAASAPIPQYYKGKRKGEGGGLALVGERGSELIMHDGKMWVTPPTPTLMNVPAEAEIFTAEKTLEILKNATNNSIAFNQYGNTQIDKYFEKQTRELREDIQNLTRVMATKKPVLIKGLSKEQAEYERLSFGRK